MLKENNVLKSNFKKNKIFKIDFDECVKDFGFKDGIISIVFYFYEMLIIYLFGVLMFKTSIYKNLESYFNVSNGQFYKFIFYIPVMILEIAPIFILLKIRRQNIKSVGIKKEKALKSILLGIIFSIPLVSLPIINAINQGKKVLSLTSLIWLFLYFLIEIAFVEELSFRGFIQTRIQGVIKIKWLGIVVVGIMFGLMHIPYQMIKANMSLSEFLVRDSGHLITTVVIHIYLVYLYTRNNDIISTSAAHTLMDFIPSMFI
jgi:membrane protease YdiL (CAAX protease family)